MRLRGLYTIPAGMPFAAALAQGLLEQAGGDPVALSRYTVLLPTRRACRTLRDTFLRLTEGRPLLLPRMQPFGDVDEDELILEIAGKESAAEILSLPPALSPLRRRILLARAIMKLPDYTRGPEQDFALAGALGRLMDQVYTEGLDLARLPGLVADRELARHWQVTVRFLEILSETWPQILAEHGVIDAADRRNRLIRALAAHWESQPPAHPVIAAGSTGSIPATAGLLRVIAGLPQGCVILPGLDQQLDEESWQILDDTHPQATLRHLLAGMDTKRTSVQPWPYSLPVAGNAAEPAALTERVRAARAWLATEMMRPAATAERWQTLALDAERKALLEQSLQRIRRFECASAEDEAKLIAVIMRETLLTQGKTAALVTPDRNLARRVAVTCQRWGIEIDDSGGQPLPATPTGSFLRLIAQGALDMRPGILAALLKHKHCHLGRPKKQLSALSARLETDLLRGTVTGTGFKPLYEAAARKEESDGRIVDISLLREIEENFARLAVLCDGAAHPFSAFLTAHLELTEILAESPHAPGAATLWQGQDGEAAALFLTGLRDQAGLLPPVTAGDYISILDQLMRTVNVRSTWGTHPRLFILGQLEARLMQADVTILAGLNEKSWPPDPGSDPWMSRPMRADFGLPAPERAIGLAAHDFVQGFCSPQVVITRARRVDGTPTVPARWLQRLDTVLQALKIEPAQFSAGIYEQWAKELDTPEAPPQPVRRPEPRPPVDMRPDELYVTAIERWMRDPYSIYARYILRLKKLPALEEQSDAAERGTIMHDVLNRFVMEYPAVLPADAQDRLIALGREMLGDKLDEPRLWGFWWPRFQRLAEWFVDHERQWRLLANNAATEAQGQATLDIDGILFTLRARADRIDTLGGDAFAVIDYKTGSCPSAKEVVSGFAPQLPLEAVILLEGGFAGIEAGSVSYIGFWKMTGGAQPGEDKQIEADPEAARQGLIRLVRAFRDPQTPYYSLPQPAKAPPAAWQDYAHLARVQEWTALEDAATEAA